MSDKPTPLYYLIAFLVFIVLIPLTWTGMYAQFGVSIPWPMAVLISGIIVGIMIIKVERDQE